ncbi:MAG TPA: hypothetical protein ENH11_03825 [Candidatus Acetothermia bacterium]|nr:hypothetical protein [Candidatus Acetothermia bacterium]
MVGTGEPVIEVLDATGIVGLVAFAEATWHRICLLGHLPRPQSNCTALRPLARLKVDVKKILCLTEDHISLGGSLDANRCSI